MGRGPLYEDLQNIDYNLNFYARILGNYEFDGFIQNGCLIIILAVAENIRTKQRAISKRMPCARFVAIVFVSIQNPVTDSSTT